MAFDIVPDRSADFARGFLGESTPLARALLGRIAGSVVRYRVGDAVEAHILAVSRAVNEPENAEARRQETIRKAVEQSDQTNAMLFASSFSGKWGDYDPTGLASWVKKPDDETDTEPTE